jgi:hypothetical protein
MGWARQEATAAKESERRMSSFLGRILRISSCTVTPEVLKAPEGIRHALLPFYETKSGGPFRVAPNRNHVSGRGAASLHDPYLVQRFV